MLLCQETVAPLLLLQSLLVAPLEELQVLALILRTQGDLCHSGQTQKDSETQEDARTHRVSSPQLPLQSRHLVVDLHLVELLAVLHGREITSGTPASLPPPPHHQYQYETPVLSGVAVHLPNDLHTEPLQLEERCIVREPEGRIIERGRVVTYHSVQLHCESSLALGDLHQHVP